MEAAASGLPVVATGVGGTREIFPNDQCGATIVEANQPDAWLAPLERLLADDALHAAHSQAARRRAEVAFDARDAGPRLVQQYHAVL